MSSYDERNSSQIAIDELILKLNRRKREVEFNAERYMTDQELLKQLNLLVSDLIVLKSIIDHASKKGDLNGKKK